MFFKILEFRKTFISIRTITDNIYDAYNIKWIQMIRYCYLTGKTNTRLFDFIGCITFYVLSVKCYVEYFKQYLLFSFRQKVRLKRERERERDEETNKMVLKY